MHYLLPSGDTILYPDLVTALAKPGDDIIATLTGNQAHAWHMASCIPGEAGELFEPLAASLFLKTALDRANVIEELGDLEFYTEGLCQAVGLYAETLRSAVLNQPYRSGEAAVLALPGIAADVFDAVKRWTIYNKPLDAAAIEKTLIKLHGVLSDIRFHFGITLREVLAANTLKLGTRYKGVSYSDAAAQKRADKEIN